MPNPGQAARVSSGSAATLYQGLVPDWVKKRAKDFFTWDVDWETTAPLAVSSSAPRSFQVDADADAYLVGITGIVSDAGLFTAPVGITPIKVKIEDTGSGRNFQNRAVMWDTLIGTAQLPGYLPYPKLVPASSTVTITLQNLDAANAWDVHVSLLGFKIFFFDEKSS